jgi:hypothetical protein
MLLPVAATDCGRRSFPTVALPYHRGKTVRLCPFCAAEIAEEAYRCGGCRRDLPAETYAMEIPLCYDHTCKACGATMTVFDRSYWQKVRCYNCGETFVANPPQVDGRA